MVSHSEKIGVKLENPCIFAALSRNSLKHLRGNDCPASLLKECPLKCPERIKNTKLRKYVATISQIIHLNENEIEWFATHMGHDIQVHREYYRLWESTLELARVGKLLLAIDSGNAKYFCGKTLDEISFNGKLSFAHFGLYYSFYYLSFLL